MPLLPIVAGGPGNQFDGSSTTNQRSHPLGGVMAFPDGRRFAYGQASGTAIATGSLCQQTLNSANFDEIAVAAAAAVGDRTVTITTGATALTVDQLKDGYLNVEDDAGEGHLYTIKSNPAVGTTANGAITLYETVQVAITTSTTVTLYVNPFSAVIIHPSPATALLLGVTPKIIAASSFGWFQTWGPASVLTQGTVVINEGVIDSASVDGAVAPTASTAAGEENYVGKTMEVAGNGEHSLVFMKIA